ncbi:MAG TPA: hypothetical protein VFX16_35695 [Pseudonocardiaceae bacterium]|nr:hypothetical protein [Pseudonocardiaceae bacterium]
MTDVVLAEQEAGDWAGCLVMVIAPQSHMPRVADAVLLSERTILGDPVLVDMARVAATSASDPLAGDPDDVARRLRSELVDWARSPAGSPAPRFAFCVLVVHPDIEDADRLVRGLAAASALSELPIVFRTGSVPPPAPDEDAQPEVDESAAIARMIIDSIIETANELDRTPSFCLTPRQLAATRQTTDIVVPDDADIAVPDDTDIVVPDHVVDPSAAQDDPEPVVVNGPTAMLRRLGSARARKGPPASNVAAINELSERADHVSMLYVVFVNGPVRPSRKDRRLRTTAAMALIRALPRDPGAGPWHVRVFSADSELRAGRPLPEPDLLDHKHFPVGRGEFFDMYRVVDDITDHIDREKSSFVRRGLQPPETVVVLLGTLPLSAAEDTADQLAPLRTVADTIWVSSDRDLPALDKLMAVGVHFLAHHEDLDDELLRLVTRRAPDEAGSRDMTRG